MSNKIETTNQHAWSSTTCHLEGTQTVTRIEQVSLLAISLH